MPKQLKHQTPIALLSEMKSVEDRRRAELMNADFTDSTDWFLQVFNKVNGIDATHCAELSNHDLARGYKPLPLAYRSSSHILAVSLYPSNHSPAVLTVVAQ